MFRSEIYENISTLVNAYNTVASFFPDTVYNIFNSKFISFFNRFQEFVFSIVSVAVGIFLYSNRAIDCIGRAFFSAVIYL